MDETNQKVLTLFRELVGDRADQLKAPIPAAQKIIADALTTNFDNKTARDIAFHMTDWHADIGFICAVLLYPERFTAAEIRSGVEGFIVHAPNHIAAAAKLSGYPIDDIFKVGALDGVEKD